MGLIRMFPLLPVLQWGCASSFCSQVEVVGSNTTFYNINIKSVEFYRISQGKNSSWCFNGSLLPIPDIYVNVPLVRS